MFYVITSPDKTSDWSFDSSAFIERLKHDWPSAVIGREDLASRDVVWTVDREEGRLEGSLDKAGSTVYLDGSTGFVAQFSAWCRHIVEANRPLILCDEAYTTAIDLTPEISANAVADALTTAPKN